MRFILSVGLLVFAVLTQSFADHEHNHADHDDDTHPCAQPKYVLEQGKVGCFASIPYWYHNHSTGKCEEATYDGCNKNGNHFETEEDCKKTCDEWHKEHKDHHHGSSKHGDCTHEGHDHDHHHHSHDGHSHHHH